MTSKANIGGALKKLRQQGQLTQEDFSLVSSRTYISSIERGLKSPTLDKVELLAERLNVTPLTLIALAYSANSDSLSAIESLIQAKKELEHLNI